MRKLVALFSALTLSAGLWAINNVPYIDANGQEQHRDGVTGVINSTDTLKAGWYVVMPTGSEKRTGTLVCEGEVHLIVYDNAKLTATGADNKPGIEVSGEGNSLTIYGYTNQSGQLIANGGANAAGIGGGNAAAGSNITIYGGVITANGGENASAIGSGKGGDAASNIFVATSFVVKADGNNPPTTVIAATRTATTDIAADLAGQRYATIAPAPAPAVSDQFVDATSGLKFEVTAVGEANTVKVLANDYEGTSYTIPATVSYQSVTFNVTEIGAEAFMNCSSLESITIPEGVTTIGGETFHECKSLVSVNMPASVTTIGESAFYGCALQSINLPANLTTIGESAFSDCALQSITIPAGVTTIGSGAFANNNGLTSVTFLGNACQNNIGEDAFYNVGSTETPATLVLPDTWTGSTPDQDGNWYGGHFDYDAPAPEYKYTEYENWQIKFGPDWTWSDNMTKVEDGLFKMEIEWDGTGFNIKSDENPIKQDWFPVEELVIGEEVIAPVIVDVYLKVIDDEHIRIGIGTNPGVGPTDAINIINTEDVPNGAIIKDGKVYIIRNGKLYNLQGSEIKNADEILKSIQF